MKKIICTVSAVLVSAVVALALCSFSSGMETTSDGCADASCQGKHCTYTVGCDCSGFSPKTDGKEWEKSYCKRCGHHKKYHK